MANKFLIKNPIISEKAMRLGREGKYLFLVKPEATVSEVKKAVQEIYNVQVVKTNVLNLKKVPGKKIVVTLKKGQKLDILPQ